MITSSLSRRSLLACAVVAAVLGQSAAYAEDAVVIPAPAQDEAPGSSHMEKAVLAGGCFWGVQGVFEHVQGVQRVVSGYAGGTKDTAQYETVGSGRTGHAESVEVTFDPAQISYGGVLQIFFSVAHNPTELNRQGPDSGPQYRSAIFPATPSQQRVAQTYIAQLDAAHVFAAPIATRIEDNAQFYPAEDYHQDFLALHPTYPYIVFNDLPKVAQLKHLFPARYREQPVLVKPAT
ncbi:MAG TPA: peptide-methionine (S)-S-oxide reductase MsrA [Patescibacteria group bacterium]|nr:peptide-methionine (S)-S-oxide reductase MsrA [Patescibacteria group bacterium]